MKKVSMALAAVFALSVFASAAEAVANNADKTGEARRAERQAKIAEFKKQFQAKREQNIAENKALYEQYQAAKTDKDKKAVEDKIKTQAAKEVDEGLVMTKTGLSMADDNLQKAKDRQTRAEKNRDKIIAKRVDDIKAGKYNQSPFGKDCDGGKCPAVPLTGIRPDAGMPPPPDGNPPGSSVPLPKNTLPPPAAPAK